MFIALIALLGMLAIYVSSDDAEQSRIRREEQSSRALALAKEVLISHAIIDAVTDPSQASPRPGELPCPARHDDGVSDGGSACSTVGWLPWKTLELEDLRDSAGARLWYAVSGDFRDDGINEPDINSAATFTGLLHILDASGFETGTAAAVIIAPGSALSGQTRSADDNVAADVIQQYLEGTNTDMDDSFSGETTISLNDQIVVITAEELVERASQLAIRQVAATIREYYNAEGYYPYPEFDTICDINTYGPANPGGHQNIAALLPLTRDGNCPYDSVLSLPTWFTDNNWDKVIVYMVAPACVGQDKNNCNGGGGFLTLGSQGGIRVMVADSGRVLGGVECSGQPSYTQIRPWPTNYQICEYLETNENTDGDLIFIQPVSSATTNDVFLTVEP